MIKLMEIWDEIVQEMIDKGQYRPINDADRNVLNTHIMLGELLDPSNAYEYSVYKNEIYYFDDSGGNMFCARLVFQPTAKPFYEFKTWWVEDGKAVYNRLPDNTPASDWSKRSDTVAKIFKDEIIPKFEKQRSTNRMSIIPVDSKRYQLSIRMVKKFIPNDWTIIEEYPKAIHIDKSGELENKDLDFDEWMALQGQ